MNSKGKKQTKKWKRILKRIIILIIVLAIAAAGVFFGIDALKASYTITYDSYTATIGSISNSLSFSGSLALIDSETYTASSAATVRAIYAKAGDMVKEGDKLLRLSNGEVIKSKLDGRVNVLSLAVDDEVAAGDTLAQVADFSRMTVSIRVDEYDISSVHVGDSVTVTTTATEQTFSSVIKSINYISSSTGNVAYYSTTLEIDNIEDGIYPGMQVTVTIPQESAENVVILKADALSFDNTNQAFVYIKQDDGSMEPKNVEVGVSNGNYTEIKSGLESEDVVYVVAETQQNTSALGSLMSGMFGGTQINGGSFPGGGNFPSSDSFPGGSFSGGDRPSGFSGGDRPSFGGGQ